MCRDLSDAAQHLGKHHTGVTARTAHGAAGQCCGNIVHTGNRRAGFFGSGKQFVSFRQGGFHSVSHIGTRVRVRHGKHVEGVELGAPSG